MNYEICRKYDNVSSMANYLQLQLINNDDLIKIMDELLKNRNVLNDASLVVFQMFYNTMGTSIHNRTFDGYHYELNTLSKYMKNLREIGKLDVNVFINRLLEEFVTLPIEIVWWLHRNEVMYFFQYCDIWKPGDIGNTLLEAISKNKEHNTFVMQKILEDLLMELLCGYYQPNLGISRLEKSKQWTEFCFKTINELIEEAINDAINKNGKLLLQILSCIENLRKRLPCMILQQFYENILLKIMCYEGKKYDLHSSYRYQQLWCSNGIGQSLFLTYVKIFEKYCTFQSVLKIINDFEDQINWQFTLAAVGACTKVSQNSTVEIKNVAIKYIEESFKGGKLSCFIKGFLFIRQSCLETSLDDYRLWYSFTFGNNSNFKTTNTTLFKFFMSSLISLIPYEPKSFLKIHINQGITAPPNFNSLVFDYKTLCKTRLEEFRHSPTILIDGIEIDVIHLIEDSFENEYVCPIMVDIIHNQYETFFNKILPQILRNGMPFMKVKQLLLDQQYITNDVLHFCHADSDEKVFNDDVAFCEIK